MKLFENISPHKPKSLKFFVNPYRPITYGIVQCGPNFIDGIPYIRPVDMSDETGIENLASLLRTDPDIARAYSRSTVATADLVISIGPSYGKVMIVPPMLSGANLTQGTARVSVNRQNSPRFVFWCLRSEFCRQQWDSRVSGATFRALNLIPLSETILPCPAKHDQVRIAQSLDLRTAKIDELIAKKRELIERLKEKRTALISHVVTKGLPPEEAAKHGLHVNPPLKPSGVPWVGDIPEHWDCRPVRRLSHRVQTGSTPPTSEVRFYENGTLNWYGPSSFGDLLDVTRPVKLLNETSVEEGVARVFAPGSTGIVTIGATLGKVGAMPGACSCNQQVTVIEFDSKCIFPRFATYALKRLESFLRHIAPSATLPILDQGEIADLVIAMPALTEQVRITEFLDQQTLLIEKICIQADQIIEMLQEYRSALITAAVTGKIDVREQVRK